MKDRDKQHKRKKAKRDEAMALVYAHYGNKCSCSCHEQNGEPAVTEPMFLTIDHINDDNKEHRIKTGLALFYQKIIDNNYPTDLRLLCYNCNCGRARNKGVCPHKE